MRRPLGSGANVGLRLRTSATVGALAATLLLALVAAPALAKATYKLSVNVPRHAKIGATYTASGLLYLNTGAEVLGVFYDKDRCSNSYSTELRRSEDSDTSAGNLVVTVVQGQFGQTFQMLKIARKAHNLCAYLAHTVGSAGKWHTDRVVKLRYSA
jgi:hypothetical protein